MELGITGESGRGELVLGAGKVLITGAAGFIGMDLCAKALDEGFLVQAVDAFRGGLYSKEVKRKRAERLRELFGLVVEEKDLTSDYLSFDSDITHVIHSAAMPGLSYSFAEPGRYIMDNEVATINLIRALEQAELQKFVFLSTSSVYGRFAEGNEETPPNPISPYGLSKLAAERIVDFYLPNFAHHSTVRLFSVYGPGQRPDMGYFQFIQSIIEERPITVFGDGSQSRSNTFIQDAVDGIFQALEYGEAGEKYNIGGGEEINLLEAINRIYELSGKRPQILFGPKRAGDQQRTLANVEKAKRRLHFKPATRFSQGIKAQWDWQSKLNA